MRSISLLSPQNNKIIKIQKISIRISKCFLINLILKILNLRFYDNFAFVDTKPYSADQIFINHNLKVKFSDKEFINPNMREYVVILVKCRKNKVEDFVKCMEELRKKILICGHNKYDEYCYKLFGDKNGGIDHV